MPDYKKLKEFKGHKLVFDLSQSSKLKGFIAIHNNNLGPALGGTRIVDYKNENDALVDALRLSEAMTYKCAIAGLPFGGGKGVILADPKIPRKEMLETYAEQVSKLQGTFYTGEDVGLFEPDVQYMLKFSPYFIGKTGLAGDPSYFAALSAFNSIKVALDFQTKGQKISGKSFAIKGVGKTGTFLAKLLAFAGGKVFVYDLDRAKMRQLVDANKNISATDEKLIEKDVDVFCPCALGDDLTNKNLDSIKARIIAGTANNQLESAEVGDKLYQRGILHVPDYIANAGGLVDVADELMPGGYSRKRVLKEIDNLKSTLTQVLKKSKKNNVSPMRVANALAEKKFVKKKEMAYAQSR